MVLDQKTKDKNLEWLICFSQYFLSKQIANKDSIPECAASFWWKRRSCPVSFRIRFIQAGTTSSYCLQFLELSTHRLRAGGTDVNIFGCAACDQHVSCMCAFGGIKLSLASRSLTGVLVEYVVVFVFQCFSLSSISWISMEIINDFLLSGKVFNFRSFRTLWSSKNPPPPSFKKFLQASTFEIEWLNSSTLAISEMELLVVSPLKASEIRFGFSCVIISLGMGTSSTALWWYLFDQLGNIPITIFVLIVYL